MKQKADVLQGTLALMVLKTLGVLGPQRGYGIARRIEQISGDLRAVNQETLAAEAGARRSDCLRVGCLAGSNVDSSATRPVDRSNDHAARGLELPRPSVE